MKKKYLIFFALVIVVVMHYGKSNMSFLMASIFTTLFAFYFLYINSNTALEQWKHRKRTIFTKSIVPFVIVYMISIILYTNYLCNLSQAEFKIKYLFTASYPYRSNFILPLLYGVGIFIGALRNNRKVLRVLNILLLAGSLFLLGQFVYSFFSSTKEIEGVTFIEERYESIEDIVALPQFENSIVYIDYWYSSCSPCIRQMKEFLPVMKEKLKSANLNVTFLYLGKETSHIDSRRRWLQTIEKYNLKGWHYYVTKADEDLMWKRIVPILRKKGKRPYGYPHFLIARNGKIVDYDAPYPEFLPEVIKSLKSE